VSFSHPGRCRNDAAFAQLAGTSPLEASHGQRTRHRLNHRGHRALNKALHTIARTRMRSDPTTKAYLAPRHAEGKPTRENRRCLKRYITRQLYPALTTAMNPEHRGERMNHPTPAHTRERTTLKDLDTNRSVNEYQQVA
jgi:transposase